MRAIVTLAMKDLRLLARDKGGLFFTAGFPVMMAVFFGTIFGGGDDEDSSVPIAVVDEDRTDTSRDFAQRLDRATELDAIRTTRAKARALVRTGKRTAYVVLPAGFGRARAHTFAGEPATIELGVDPSRRAEAKLLEGVLTRYAFESLIGDRRESQRTVKESLAAARVDPRMDPGEKADLVRFLGEMDRFLDARPTTGDAGGGASGGGAGFSPIEIRSAAVAPARSGPKNPYAVSFPQGILWAVLGCAATFGIGIVVEREKGTLARLRTAPISAAQILAGKALACWLAIVAVETGMLLLARVAFGVRPISLGLLAVVIPSIAVAFVGIMMLLSVVGRTERSAAGIGWAVVIVMSMFGGGMIPLLFMPSWMRALSSASPVKWAILALEGAVWRGLSPTEMIVPCGILLAVGVLGFLVGARAFRRE